MGCSNSSTTQTLVAKDYMQQFFSTLSNEELIKKYHHLQRIMRPCACRDTYLGHLDDVFKSADKNSNGIIEVHEIEDLLVGYFEVKGFQPPRDLFDHLIGHYKKKHPKGMDMRHFEHYVDHINL